jgi:hypothetical protein
MLMHLLSSSKLPVMDTVFSLSRKRGRRDGEKITP